ncbi:MAG: hypothetical protein GY781_10770 [Gammaproteobacteria bacterium]|nr:hypothetical protein [Gammaproteobacteria bacterium]
MNEAVEKGNKGKVILISGCLLFVCAVVVGPPIGVLLGLPGLILVLVGLRKHRSTLPKKIPLSQQSPKAKIYLAGPASIGLLIASQFSIHQRELTFGIGLFLLAYALIGVIELKFGEIINPLSVKWNEMASWKKFIISFAVIVTTLVAVIATMPIIARAIYA